MHVNRCKQWHPVEASVLGIVVATERKERRGYQEEYWKQNR